MRPCRRWTDAEDALIAAEYATANLDELAVRMGRTVKAIRKHAQDMKVVRPHRGNNGKRFPSRKRPAVCKPVAGPWMLVQSVVLEWVR